MTQKAKIIIRGAREHNLRNVDLTIPRDALIVLTGLSGSGKSSLAFDTLFKEGQRRFMESLSAYARQFLGQMEKPDVDHIEGLSPTISIDQKTINRNPRSTVGTITEIYDHLRLLFARLGTPHCPNCGRVVANQTPEQIADSLYLEAGAQPGRGMILAPVVQDRKGEYRREMAELLRNGYLRARIDGTIRNLDEEIVLDRYVRHTIEVVIDRVVFDRASRGRITEAIEKALEMTRGMVSALIGDVHRTFATERACPDCRISIPEMEPRVFSFNSPHGACPECEGLGERAEFSEALIIPDPRRSLEEQAIACMTREGKIPFSSFGTREIGEIIRAFGATVKTPWAEIPEEARHIIIHGSKHVLYTHSWSRDRKDGQVTGTTRSPFEGVIPALEIGYKYTHADFLETYRLHTVCHACHGKRLSPVSLAVTFRDKTIWDLSTGTVDDVHNFLEQLAPTPREALIGREIFKELRSRLHFLQEVGLGYLSLDRSAATLAGGEAQRIRLARQVGSGLQGVLYVLDEPSIGLHPRDNRRLLNTLIRLRDIGNTVLVVEHDRETMETADYLVDIGPGAGSEGGRIMDHGTVAKVLRGNSLTARYLKGEEEIPLPASRRPTDGETLVVRGARHHNLKNIDVVFPLGTFIAVTGVSGSGKSTLISDILHKALARKLHRAEIIPGEYRDIEGIEHLDKVIEIDQTPIGRTPRSNPATYTKVFDEIRSLFANLPESRLRGYPKGRFSFNVPGGRCETCGGAGVKEIEMQFLANVQIPCEDCDGKRFNLETLAVHYREKSINDVLNMTVAEAADFFQKQPRIRRTLSTMVAVGLGYVRLGQPSTTLSGGEAQRVKLATELQRPATGRTLYILDEPTTGLHAADIRNLLSALQQLVDNGNTVIVIEHNLDVIKVADYVIDLGPEGGAGGGRVIATGTPEALVGCPESYTGLFLADVLGSAGSRQDGAASPLTGAVRSGDSETGRDREHPRDLILIGASKNNLKHIDVTIPRNKLTVVTGVSGSGKTSLAFDTLFAEGQRRYVESLSTYARRFLGRLDKAPVESLEGIAPSISVDQKAAPRNPRSTVATNTEINDYFRLLFARLGKPHCPTCDAPLEGFSPEQAANRLLLELPGQRGEILAPLAGNGSSSPVSTQDQDEEPEARIHSLEVRPLLAQGFLRLRVDDVLLRLDGPDVPRKVQGRRIDLVLDRVAIEPGERSRVTEALENAFGMGSGAAFFRPEQGRLYGFSTVPGCLKCGFFLREELTPQLFSFNSHVGACSRCDGLGTSEIIDTGQLIVDPSQAILDGAMSDFASKMFERRGRRYVPLLGVVGQAFGFNPGIAWNRLSADARQIVLEGCGDKMFHLDQTRAWGGSTTRTALSLKWRGLLAIMEGWYRESSGDQEKVREQWKKLLVDVPCPECHGARLKKLPLAVRVGGLNIAQLSSKTVTEAIDFFKKLRLEPSAAQIAKQILAEVRSRLSFLGDVGLDYLTLDRPSGTLSGGESQRIRLASQLGSHLVGVLYVLDEPTIGLHPRDTERLLGTLLGLRDRGNTVVVVEHDAQTIRAADHIIDLGPGAGERGGEIVAQGSPAALMKNPRSLTGIYLAGQRSIPVPQDRRQGTEGVRVVGACANNLRNLDVHFPLGVLACVTGVSGSGKSTLVMDVLAGTLAGRLNKERNEPGLCRDLKMVPAVTHAEIIDQSPLGRSPRSNSATYVGVLDPIRALFASTPEARMRGYGASRFSFNLHGGRCEACEGRGAVKVEMHFLSDVWVPCERCKGRRYNEQTLQVKFKGKTIADVLDMEVREALEFFQNQRKIHRMLAPLAEVGLEYLRVGQAANTLSGGEAQRVKLASALMERSRAGFYILDEPTTGLHFQDVEKLVAVLQRLVDKGNTVVVIEHNLEVIKVSDWIIDLGPEGGADGGRIVAQGTPEQVAAVPESHTGRVLREVLPALQQRLVS